MLMVHEDQKLLSMFKRPQGDMVWPRGDTDFFFSGLGTDAFNYCGPAPSAWILPVWGSHLQCWLYVWKSRARIKSRSWKDALWWLWLWQATWPGGRYVESILFGSINHCRITWTMEKMPIFFGDVKPRNIVLMLFTFHPMDDMFLGA